VPTLEALVAAGHEVALVVTQPDRPGHRLRLTPPRVKVAAERLRLAVSQPPRIRDREAVEEIARARAQLLVVAAYGQIVPRSVLDLPESGALNVHASLLPRWRGAAPVAHAILAGDQVTGVTIMRMDEQLDHGPVLASREAAIGPHEDAAALTARLAALGADLLLETLPRLDSIVPEPQDESRVTLAPKLQRSDGELEWASNSSEIDRRVRGLQPWPGVTLPFGGRRLKVLEGRALSGRGAPGEVLAVGPEGVEVACGAGSYLLVTVQAPGSRPVPARVLAAAG
jgi:methionyl-tRNA formyltransferase